MATVTFPTTPTIIDRTVALAAAAFVVAMLIVGALVASFGGSNGNDTVVPRSYTEVSAENTGLLGTSFESR